MQWIKVCDFILKAVANMVDNLINKTINVLVFVSKVPFVPVLQSSLQVYLEKRDVNLKGLPGKNKNKLPHSVS